MYFTRLPEANHPDFDEHLHFRNFREHNIIYHAHSDKSYCERHVGCLSIKTVFKGEEWYGIDQREIAVRPGQFLVLNDNQEYSSRIGGEGQTDTLSVFFSPQFAATVFRDMSNNEEVLLDNPFITSNSTPEFFQSLTDIGYGLNQNLFRLTNTLKRNKGIASGLVDEHLIDLLYNLIQYHSAERNRAKSINAVKASTKMEIYKRLCIAKDLLHSTYMHKTDLSMIGASACLSVPQLVRQFKTVFNITPHQYLNQVRFTRASALLKDTQLPVNEISWKCGFEDTSAFCRAFRFQYGVSPVSYRKLVCQN